MENEDKYELICNPTNEIKDMNETVIVSEKKEVINSENGYDYTFKGFLNSIFFKIIISIIGIYIFYYLWKLIINKITSNSSSSIKVGGKKRR